MSHSIAIIAAVLIVGGSALGQSTSGWQTVTTDGSGLYTNNVILGGDTGFFLPAYAYDDLGGNPALLASSVNVTDGTIESGTVTNTWARDQSYLIVGESGRFKIDFTFTNLVGKPVRINWTGYYAGNPSHEINLDIWNFTDSTWDSVADDVFPSGGTTEFSIGEQVPSPQTNYFSGGVCTERCDHVSSAVGSHDFATDFIGLQTADVTLGTIGDYVQLAGFSPHIIKNMTYGNNAVTTSVDGVFQFGLSSSFTGTTNSRIQLAFATNSVQIDTTSYRTIDESGDVGNASFSGFVSATNGTEFTVWARSDTANSYISFYSFAAYIKKIDN